MTRKPFSLEHEEVSDRVAEERLKESRQVYDSFTDRPYNAENLSPQEQAYAYSMIRTNPDYLNKLHAEEAKRQFLPPGVLSRSMMKGFGLDEARHLLATGQFTQKQYDRAVAAWEKPGG